MHCGYDISGTTLDDEGCVVCPECGIKLTRSHRIVFTRKQLHIKLLTALVWPFLGWSAVTLLCITPVLQHSLLTGIIALSYIYLYPVVLLVTSLCTWPNLHSITRPYPRPYPLWSIPLWMLMYLIAPVSMFIGTIVIMDGVL